MNSASEIIVRWYFEEQGADDGFTDDLVATLYEGCARREDDALGLLARILATAEAADKEAPWDAILPVAAVLHREIEETDRAIHNLGQLSVIAEAMENMPDNGIARRITMMKVRDCVARLRG